MAQHPSDLVRDQYAMQLAGRLQIDVDRLRAAIAARVGGSTRRDGGSGERTRTYERAGGARNGSGPPARDARRDAAVGPVRIDRREEDVLRWAVHEPAIVADWLEASLLRDPIARDAFECLASAATFDDALAHADGPVRELLERLAVEEPDAGEQDDRVALAARVMVNTVAPRAEDVIARMLDDGDERVVEVKAALDRLRHARDFGDWPAARDAARQLLGWIRESPGLRVGAGHVTTESHGPTVTG